MIAVAGNPALQPVADEAARRLRAALDSLADGRPGGSPDFWAVHRVAWAARDRTPDAFSPHHDQISQRPRERLRGMHHSRVLRSAGPASQVRDIMPHHQQSAPCREGRHGPAQYPGYAQLREAAGRRWN